MLTGAGAFLLVEFAIDSITATITWWRNKPGRVIDVVLRVISPITAFTMFSVIIMGVIEAGSAFGIPSTSYALAIIAMTLPGIYFIFRSYKVKIIIPEWIIREVNEGRNK